MEGRKERRSLRRLRVLLSSLAQPLLEEHASTQNVTSLGLRVETYRPWELDTIVLIKTFQGEFWALARVVYCKPLQDKTFVLGLELLAQNNRAPLFFPTH